MENDIALLIRAVGADRVRAELDKVTQGLTGAGNEAHKSGEKTGRFGRAINSIGSSLVGLVGSFASVFVAMRAFSGYLDAIVEKAEQVRKLRAEFGGSATEGFRAVVKLQEQLGYEGDEGYIKTLAIARTVATSGGVGLDVGANIAQAVFSNIQGTRKEQLGIARMLAGVAGKGGLSAAQTGAIAEFISAAGVSDVAGATKLTAQAQAALLASASLGFGQFGKAAIKGGVGLLTRGASPAEMLSRLVQARAVSGGDDDRAQETVRMVTMAMDRPKVREYIKGVAGGEVAIDEGISILGALFTASATDPTARALKEDIVPIEQAARLTEFFSPAALGARTFARKQIAASSANELEEKIRLHRASYVAKSQNIKTESLIRRATAAIHHKDKTLSEEEARLQVEEMPMELEMGLVERAWWKIGQVEPTGIVRGQQKRAELEYLKGFENRPGAGGTGTTVYADKVVVPQADITVNPNRDNLPGMQ